MVLFLVDHTQVISQLLSQMKFLSQHKLKCSETGRKEKYEKIYNSLMYIIVYKIYNSLMYT